MTKEETGKLLIAIAAFFNNFQTNAMTLELWHGVLEQVDFRESMKALKVYACGPSPFAPAPGQLIEIIKQEKDGLDPPADVALTMALEYLFHGSKEPLHPRIKEVLEFVDISRLGPPPPYNPHGTHIDARDERFMQQQARRDFIRAYQEGIQFEKKRHSRELARPEKELLEAIKQKRLN